MDLRFSANLGFLWTELALPDAVHAAAAAGFDAVELHWPYTVDATLLADALEKAGVPALGLNTARGDVGNGDFGLSALPGRSDEARAAIDDAIAYAVRIGAKAVHVMAGKTDAAEAEETFVENLRYAADRAMPHGITILLEPLNLHDVPGYFLTGNAHAATIIEASRRDNVRIMFDCYHVGRRGEQLMAEFVRHRGLVGHVQFAGLPDRGEPDRGEVDYRLLLPALVEQGFAGIFGAEYKPRGSTEAGLGWLKAWKGS